MNREQKAHYEIGRLKGSLKSVMLVCDERDPSRDSAIFAMKKAFEIASHAIDHASTGEKA